jgi:hypothetical protein
MDKLVDNCCPLFMEMLRISEMEFQFDIAQLGDVDGVFSTNITAFLEDKCTICTDYEYNGPAALVPEGNNRCLFLSSIAYTFLRMIDDHPSLVTYRHRVEFVCFNMREVNGVTLIVGIMEELRGECWRKEVKETFLSPTCGSFYMLLSKAMRKVKGGKTNVSSMNPRWQHVDQMLFRGLPGDLESVDLYIRFVEAEFNLLRTGNVCECDNVRRRLTNRAARDSYLGGDHGTKKAVQLGVVRGTFGIHLGSYLGAIPADNASFAAIEQGTSGFYLCVNHLLKDELGVDYLTTADAADEVERMVAGMVKHGLKVDRAWLDQNCCCWWRQFGKSGRDNRKKDVFFLEKGKTGRLFLPMRHRLRRRGHCIEFFVSKEWFNLQDYLAEIGETTELTGVIKKNKNWKEGSLQAFRDKMCGASLLM